MPEADQEIQEPRVLEISKKTSLPRKGRVAGSAAQDSNGLSIALLGGKGVGKSYLFQAMVYRTLAGDKSGVLGSFLKDDAIKIKSVLIDETKPLKESEPVSEAVAGVIKSYNQWERLETTKLSNQRLYELMIPYRKGLFRNRLCKLHIEFVDGSGDSLQAPLGTNQHEIDRWYEFYGRGKVVVFCLPLWAAFPTHTGKEPWVDADLPGGLARPSVTTMKSRGGAKRLSPTDHLRNFQTIVNNYGLMCEARGVDKSQVQVIVALTMADDLFCRLSDVRNNWIAPFVDAEGFFLKRLHRPRYIARYIANARAVSQQMRAAMADSRNRLVNGIRGLVNFGKGEPWLIPMSAIDGATLDAVYEAIEKGEDPPKPTIPPVPVHVELPLLLALCERERLLL